MKKQELIHIHALLFEVGEYVKREGEPPVDPFETYEEQSTRPQHIHRGKDAHTAAINRLLGGCLRVARPSHQHSHSVSTERPPR